MITASDTDIRQTIRTFIESAVRMNGLSDDENLFESGIVNSLFAIQLMAFLEKTFDIEVSPDDLDIAHFQSVNAMTAFVARKQGPQDG